jgi:hypothetical protein
VAPRLDKLRQLQAQRGDVEDRDADLLGAVLYRRGEARRQPVVVLLLCLIGPWRVHGARRGSRGA